MVRPLIFSCFFILLFGLFVSSGYAKRFTNQYCEFELPPGWKCVLEGQEWVCQSENANRKKESIIILAAKVRGIQDDLDKYLAYLKKTKTFSLPGGKAQVSDSKYAKLKVINDHKWVDALHLASEVPGFYTRYLATVKEDLGVAVTFSVGKDHYSSYQPVFENMIKSLRVFRQKAASVGDYQLKTKKENLLEETTFIPDSDQRFDISHKQKRKGKAGTSTGEYGFYFLVLVGVAAVVYIKKKGKGKGKKK